MSLSFADTDPDDKTEDLVNDDDALEREDVIDADMDGLEGAEVDGADVDAGIGAGAASPTSSECPFAFTRDTKLHPSINQS